MKIEGSGLRLRAEADVHAQADEEHGGTHSSVRRVQAAGRADHAASSGPETMMTAR
jgi:hypothetical protein